MGEDLGPIGSSWRAAQMPGHIFTRHAPYSCLKRGSRFGGDLTIGFGLGLPTWLLRVGAPGNNRGVSWPTIRGVEVQAAPSFGPLDVPSVSDSTGGSELDACSPESSGRPGSRALRLLSYSQWAAKPRGKRSGPHSRPRVWWHDG